MDNLDFLDGAPAPKDEVVPAAEVPTEAPQEAEPAAEAPAEVAEEPAIPRDEKGRFAPKQPEAAQEPASPPPGYVPVGVVQAMRAEINQLKAAQQPVPEIWDQPTEFVNHQVQPVRNEVTELKLEISRLRSESQYGAELVNTAEQWAYQRAQVEPAFGQQIIASKDPYGAAVAAYKQEQISSKLSDPARIDAFLAWEAAQAQAQANPQPAAPAANPQPTPTRSLATAPSSGGAQHVPSGPGQAFDNLFMR